MNLVYFKFLFAITIKKKPIWLTWLLFAFTLTMFIIILPLVARMNPYQVWANTTMTVCETFLGMTVALFTAVLAINIFKDSNEEGTELIIISKPITRTKIVWTKFFVYFVFCLMLNLTAVLISCFTIFIPQSDTSFYWGLVLSMFIGNIVSFGVFGSIAILLTVKFAKVGVIITNVVISLIFLVYQILTLFVFKTPLKATTDLNVVPDSYTIMDRNIDSESKDYGSYVEKNIVNFDSSPLDIEKGTFAIDGNSWKDIVDYWEDNIKLHDPSKILNITDLAGQVSLTYLCAGIYKYAARQATRALGLSRFWDYSLTSPASPEIIEPEDYRSVTKEKWQSIPIIYASAQEIDYENILHDYFGVDIIMPGAYGFQGMKFTKGASLSGAYGEKLGVGYIKKEELFTRKDVFLEPDDWKKYAPGFDEIYENIYNYDLEKEIDGKREPFYTVELGKDPDDSIFNINSTWSNKRNMPLYYKLIWGCLTNHENEIIGYDLIPFDFEVDSVEELNERFIQYKFYIFYKIYKDQQKLINSNVEGDELIAKEIAYSYLNSPIFGTLPSFLELLNVQCGDTCPNDWWLKYSYNGSDNINLLAPNTQTINLWLMYTTAYVYEFMLDLDINDPNDRALASKTALGTYLKLSNIFTSSSNPREGYMYTSLETPKRTTEYIGDLYVSTNSYQPYILSEISYLSTGTYLPYGINMTVFFYEAKQTLDFWIYAIIWIIISMCLFASGVFVYHKYDIK